MHRLVHGDTCVCIQYAILVQVCLQATDGVGRVAAGAFAEKNAHVIVHGRDLEKTRQCVLSIMFSVCCDFTQKYIGGAAFCCLTI